MWKTGVHMSSWVQEIADYRPAPWDEYLAGFNERFSYDDLDALLGRIAAMGFGYTELWLPMTGDAGRAPLWKGKTPEDVVKLHAKHGLQIASFCPSGITRAMDARWLLEYTRALGVNLITGWLDPDPAYWAELARMLERYDLTFAIEPHPPEYSISTLDEVLQACALSDRYGACPDTGGMWRRGYTAVEGITKVLPRMLHVHLKGRSLARNAWAPPGEDDIGLGDVVRLLKANNYQGVYSIEHITPYRPDAELKRGLDWMLGVLTG